MGAVPCFPAEWNVKVFHFCFLIERPVGRFETNLKYKVVGGRDRIDSTSSDKRIVSM